MHIKTTPKEKCLPGSNKVATLLSLLNPSNYILSSSTLQSQKKKQTEEKAKVVAAVWGTRFIQFHAALLAPGWFEEKDEQKNRTDDWQNGCFRKIDGHLVYTTPNHHPSKIDVLPKTFLQIIHAAKWLRRHGRTRTSPKQPRRLLPSILSVSFSMTVVDALIKLLTLEKVFLHLKGWQESFFSFSTGAGQLASCGRQPGGEWYSRCSFKKT